jgi:hypothetical protein
MTFGTQGKKKVNRISPRGRRLEQIDNRSRQLSMNSVGQLSVSELKGNWQEIVFFIHCRIAPMLPSSELDIHIVKFAFSFRVSPFSRNGAPEWFTSVWELPAQDFSMSVCIYLFKTDDMNRRMVIYNTVCDEIRYTTLKINYLWQLNFIFFKARSFHL